MPPIAVRVSEYRLHRVRCPECAAETRAELPSGVPGGAFGPRLQAAVATLAVRNRVSRRDTVELIGELSAAGSRPAQRLLFASQTCRLQGRSLFAYLAATLAANARGDPVPSRV